MCILYNFLWEKKIFLSHLYKNKGNASDPRQSLICLTSYLVTFSLGVELNIIYSSCVELVCV